MQINLRNRARASRKNSIKRSIITCFASVNTDGVWMTERIQRIDGGKQAQPQDS